MPSVIEAAEVCVAAGASMSHITVHPRGKTSGTSRAPTCAPSQRASPPSSRSPALEFNIEGDPRPDWVDLVCETRPAQATLVPVSPGEVTSHAGWVPERHRELLDPAIERIHAAGVRVSLFVDPTPEAITWARTLGADRVELYTEPFARAFERGPADAQSSFAEYVKAAELAHSLELGINAGHDLDLDNLVTIAKLPHLDEVSIGHAIISRALFVGLDRVVREYASRSISAPGVRGSPRWKRAETSARRVASWLQTIGGAVVATARLRPR